MRDILIKGYAGASYAIVVARTIADNLRSNAQDLEDPSMLERAIQAGEALVASATQFTQQVDACRDLYAQMQGPVSIPVSVINVRVSERRSA